MTNGSIQARVERADPLVADAGDVAGSPWGVALAGAVLSTDPAAHDGRAVGPPRRSTLQLALAVAAAVAVTAGAALGARELLRPSAAVERGVESLTLPASDVGGLTPEPGTLRPILSTQAEGTTWGLWTIGSRDRGTVVVLGAQTAGGTERVALGGCPEPAPGGGGGLCLATSTPAGTALVGRTSADAAAVRAVLAGGSIVDGAVREGVFLVVAPPAPGEGLTLPDRVEVLDDGGTVIATLRAEPGG